ncbi:hypothetical protein MKX03_008259 [Papaver bracteatum]|nr:hypothetical protein MKX03_008259 [Papaver bracteatum]
MAEGFIKLSDETNEMSMEDICKQYFNNLLESQIFEVADIEKDNSGSVKSIRLDELTHKLAREVAEDCAILKVSEMENTTDPVRRLRLLCEQDAESISTPNNLRTLVGIQRLNSKQIAKVFSNKHLRVLELRNCRIGMLPDLSKLIHLRMSSVKCLGNELYGGESSTTRPWKECSQWEQLLALEQLSYLEVLSINGVRSVKRLGNELHEGEGSTSGKQPTGLFPSLTELTLEYMEKIRKLGCTTINIVSFPASGEADHLLL